MLLPAIRDPPLPRHGGGMKSWGLQLELANELERDRLFSRASAAAGL